MPQAKIGLEALIDEVTGYQYERPKDDLRKRYAKSGGEEVDYTMPNTLPLEETPDVG